jgi:ferredoxin-NADP reductase
MVEIIINDGLLSTRPEEERIIRLISEGTYKDEDMEASMRALMRFFYIYASAKFVNDLTKALNQRNQPEDM